MEAPHDDIRRDGFFFDEQTFRLDLYRLLCCFYSSADFARLRGRLATIRIADIGGDFEEFEITRLLVNIAATVRIVQDRDKDYFRKVKTRCGYFIPDVARPRKREPLSLREACNKIIHARKFNFDVRPIPVRDGEYVGPQNALRPFMHLYGEQNSVTWKAALDIVAFVSCNARLIKG